MKKMNRSDFNMGRSFWLIGIDVFFALIAMMLVIQWRYQILKVDEIPANIDHKAAYIAAAATLINWVLLRQDRAIWRFTTLDDFKRISVGIVAVALTVPCLAPNGDDFAKWGFPRLIPSALNLWPRCAFGWACAASL